MRFAPSIALGALLLFAGTLLGAETLYNGIELPAEWPPNGKTFPSEDPLPPYLEQPPKVIRIDVGRQLFIDDFLIEQTDMPRTYHKPVYHPANPVLKPERAHEMEGDGPTAAPYSGGVYVDPQDGKFKLWYMGGYIRHLCLATSDDGINWTRPDLDVVKGTNIVFYRGAPESNSLLMDPDEKDPQKRFKYVYFKAGGEPSWAMEYRYSADGIHWSEPQWRSGPCGDRTTVFHNPFRNKYVFLIRASANLSGRAKMYWETGDLNDAASVQWPGDGVRQAHAPLWARADLGRDFTRPEMSDMPQLYHLDAAAYESVIVGLFAIHRGRYTLAGDKDGRNIRPGRPKCNELTVGFSRDGFHWYRPDHATFMGVSETVGAWNWGNIQPVGALGLVVGDHIYFYCSGRAGDPAMEGTTEWSHDAGISTGVAVLRRDGFASMDWPSLQEASTTGSEQAAADRRPGIGYGTLTTRPLTFEGKHFFVNVDCPEGELRVEVLDVSGKVIAPFSSDACQPVAANSTIQHVRWNGAADLSDLAGKEVRFRFRLKGGSLYSFWVSPDESGASRGYVLGGGPGFTAHADTVGKRGYPANRTPFAKAGPDQQVRDASGVGSHTIMLDGSRSMDSDGSIESYAWLVEGRQIAAGARASVELPVGTHTVTLAVTDDKGASGYDNVTITVKPQTDPVPPQDGLVMWLKADAIAGAADGAPVARWDDASPNQLFSAQEDKAKQPVWVQDGIGGKPAVRFDGQDDALRVDQCPGLLYAYYNSTLFAVARTDKGGAVISHGHTALKVSGEQDASLFYTSAYKNYASGELQWPLVQTVKQRGVPLGQPAILAVRRSSGETGGTALYVNGVRSDNGTAMAYHRVVSDNGFIGVGYNKREHWQGDIAEIILYGRALSDEECRAVEQYLAKRYGIAVTP